MPRGNKCLFCDNFTLHLDSSESFRECSTCGFAGWRVGDRVSPGSGQRIDASTAGSKLCIFSRV